MGNCTRNRLFHRRKTSTGTLVLHTASSEWAEETHLKDSDTQRMGQLVLIYDERTTPSVMHIDTGEGVELGVHPVEPVVKQV